MEIRLWHAIHATASRPDGTRMAMNLAKKSIRVRVAVLVGRDRKRIVEAPTGAIRDSKRARGGNMFLLTRVAMRAAVHYYSRLSHKG